MTTKPFEDATVDFYEEQFCVHMDSVYRFCLFTTLNMNDALAFTQKTFQSISDDIENIYKTGDLFPLKTLLNKAWNDIKGSKESQTGKSDLFNKLADLSRDERAVIGCCDVLDIPPRDCVDILQLEAQNFRDNLSSGRKKMLDKTDLH